MIAIEQNTELNVLKAQMEVLRRNLATDEIVSREMMEAAVKARVGGLMAHRRWNLVAIAADVAIGVLFAAMAVLGRCSIVFAAATVAWAAFWVVVNVQQYRADLRRRLLESAPDRPLLAMAEDVALLRRQNQRQGMAAAVATVLWSLVLLREIWADVTADVGHAVFVFVIMAFVITWAATAYCRINAATSRLLGQIRGVKNEAPSGSPVGGGK